MKDIDFPIDLERGVSMSTLERLKTLFMNKFEFNIEELTPTTTLELLGLDSLDKIEFMFDIENEFKIKIPDEEFKVETIQDMVDAIDRFLSQQVSPPRNSKAETV